MGNRYEYKVVKQGTVKITEELLDEIQCPNCKGTGKETFSTLPKGVIQCGTCGCQFKVNPPKR